MKYYAGIGSRALPFSIVRKMVIYARVLATKGWTLRSGGASGSDTAFETGCDLEQGLKEIYLPWKGFNHNKSPLVGGQSLNALKSVAQYHPAPQALSEPVKKLMARNYNQIFGENSQPSILCVCYTPEGQLTGGTSQALRLILAEVPECVIVNLGFVEQCKDITSEDFTVNFHCENCKRKLTIISPSYIGCTYCGNFNEENPNQLRILNADRYARECYAKHTTFGS